jgi:hypothetical protein
VRYIYQNNNLEEGNVKKRVFSVLVIVLLVAISIIGLTGCGAGSQQAASTVAPMATKTLVQSYGLDKNGYYASEDGGSLPRPTTTSIVVTQEPPTSAGSAAIRDRMVIKTASMALVVEDVNFSLGKIEDLAMMNGGYVINSDIREEQSRLYASISFKVVATKFEDTLQALRKMSVDVRSESTSGQDVTEEYVDLDSQLRNLQASETQLLALMEKAGTVKDILEVQQQLTSTRGQIEQLKGRMQYLEQNTALSSVYVNLEQSKLTVEFTASATTVREGDDVYFNPNISGGFAPYSYEWDFGDGKTSTEANPVHSFKSGTYTVTLKIKDDKSSNADETRKDYINVLTGWDAGNVASSAWNGLVGFGRFLVSFLIWIGILSPIWIVILVILYFTWWRKRKKKA